MLSMVIDPLLLIWVGYGITPKVIVVILIAFFPITVNTVDGLRSVDTDMVNMMRTLGASRWQIFTNVQVPHGDNHDMWINPTNNKNIINANDGGANVSFNAGRSWSTQRNQPTVQFYRVSADNQCPYHLYGGQQDNSSVGIASAALGGVTWKDWYASAGCESAYLAFDPDRRVAPRPGHRVRRRHQL